MDHEESESTLRPPLLPLQVTSNSSQAARMSEGMKCIHHLSTLAKSASNTFRDIEFAIDHGPALMKAGDVRVFTQ